jgi:hypothetical protein
VVRSQEWVEARFGRFAWRDDPDRHGAIEILGEWPRRNIVSVVPPFGLCDGLGRGLPVVHCHRLAASALERALDDLAVRGLAHLMNTFDGCFVPRHMGWNPKRALSRHSWGIAVDVNARMFPYGSRARQDSRLLRAFERQGFTWGGRWRTPDPMHFELVDLSQPARPLEILADGERIVSGFLHDGRAVAPVREIAEYLGASVEARIADGEVEIHSTSGGDVG